LARDHADHITFIGVGGLDGMDRLERFVDTHDLHHFPHAATEDGGLYVHFDLTYHPAWVLLDPDGEIVLRGVRPSMAQVEDALDALAGG
jgi:hypothetical protein